MFIFDSLIRCKVFIFCIIFSLSSATYPFAFFLLRLIVVIIIFFFLLLLLFGFFFSSSLLLLLFLFLICNIFLPCGIYFISCIVLKMLPKRKAVHDNFRIQNSFLIIRPCRLWRPNFRSKQKQMIKVSETHKKIQLDANGGRPVQRATPPRHSPCDSFRWKVWENYGVTSDTKGLRGSPPGACSRVSGARPRPQGSRRGWGRGGTTPVRGYCLAAPREHDTNTLTRIVL